LRNRTHRHDHPRHSQHPDQFGPFAASRYGFDRGSHRSRGHHHHSREDHGRRTRVFDSGELRLVLLKLIADQPRHGYDLIRAIAELTGGAYEPSPGIVYPTLTLLADMGQIAEEAAVGARKSYTVTPEGTAQLDERKDEVAALFARLAALAEARERTDGGPVRRAMGNLRTVLTDKLSRDGIKQQTLHDAAAILDEAAQRIERL